MNVKRVKVFKKSILLALCLLFACRVDRRSEIEEAMLVYNHQLLSMNADSIAFMYTENGALGDIIGRDSIRNFLNSFTDVRVLDQHSQTKSIIIQNDIARQEGSYQQKVIVKSDTLSLSGQYWATWINADGKWYILKMVTKPN